GMTGAAPSGTCRVSGNSGMRTPFRMLRPSLRNETGPNGMERQGSRETAELLQVYDACTGAALGSGARGVLRPKCYWVCYRNWVMVAVCTATTHHAMQVHVL